MKFVGALNKFNLKYLIALELFVKPNSICICKTHISTPMPKKKNILSMEL
jgi:hypothetical protein